MHGLYAKTSTQTPALLCSQCVLVTLPLPSWSSAETARSHAERGQALTKLPINLPDGWASPSNSQHLDANRHAALAATWSPGQHLWVCTQQDRQVAACVPPSIITTFYSWHGAQRDEWGWYEKWHHPAIMCLIIKRWLCVYIHTQTHKHTSLHFVTIPLSCTSTTYLKRS